jgi:predicted metal-dependent enzyme (double-stranded beta helix superfamily)
MPFNKEQFISSCLHALRSDNPQQLIAEKLSELVTSPLSIVETLGKPERATIEKIYVSPELTIIHVVWPPKAKFLPHNHNTWSVIGVYYGREENIFWRRIEGNSDGKIEAMETKSIACGEVVTLGSDVIHSVTNPRSSFTSAIHVYGGNFFEIERSEWEPTTLLEQAYDVAKNVGS